MRKTNRFNLYLLALVFFFGCANPTTNSPKSSTKTITAFSFADLPATGVIDETNHIISVSIPTGPMRTGLVPTIVFSGKSVSPLSGIAQDFTNPLDYTITAEDDSEVSYSVVVNNSDFQLKGLWVITFTDPNNINNVYAANMYFTFTNSYELEYDLANDYTNGTTSSEADIEYNNTINQYIKHFSKGIHLSKFQKITSIVTGNNIIQTHYQLYDTLSSAKSSTTIVAIGNGTKY